MMLDTLTWSMGVQQAVLAKQQKWSANQTSFYKGDHPQLAAQTWQNQPTASHI